MVLRVALFAAVFVLPLFPSHLAAIDDSRELASYCEAVERGVVGTGTEVEIPDTKEAVLCWGYMEAFQHLAALADQNGARVLGACPPEKETLLDLVRSFVVYARSHRSALPDNTAVAVLSALQQTYPCSPTRQSSQRPARK